jgi:predicted ABC-type ATPase
MPRVVVLGGINGAGKTTASTDLLRNVLKIPTFVNADAIARGLNGLNPESVSFPAGRIMLEQMNALVKDREDFAFETTLSARTYANWLRDLRVIGYEVFLYYYWLRSPEIAIGRVASRVRAGGHFIPDADIRRRYTRSVSNFLNLYRIHADTWEVYDNSDGDKRLIALGSCDEEVIADGNLWADFQRSADHG